MKNRTAVSEAPDTFKHVPGGTRPYLVAKRVMDITLAIVGLIVLSPLCLVIALGVKLTSPGPVFYRGLRTGLHGEAFHILKFRSMGVGADKGAGTTSRNDPRVTPVGNVIRRYKLDELPQLINVIVGDMSLVGPRPELPKYTEQYEGLERLILDVRPGITDYASIEFSNLNEMIDDSCPDKSFEENVLQRKNELRIKYAQERSFSLDVKLIVVTVCRVLGLR